MRTAVLLCLALAILPGAAAGVPRVAFLHAEAGENGASGGHVALRVGDHAYHYQRDDEGALVLVRDAWRDFSFHYRARENRALAVRRVALPDDAAEALRAHLDARFLSGRIERARIAALADDVALLEALADPERGFALRGAGFFAHARSDPDRGRATTAQFAALRERIEARYGGDHLATRRREAAARLRSLSPDDASESATDLDAYAFSQRYADAWAASRALALLDGNLALRPEAVRALPGRLDSDARRSLAARAEALTTSLAALIDSARPDWGHAFLVGAARLAALAESLDRGSLLVLDALPATVERVPLSGSPAVAAAHEAWRRERRDAAHRRLLAHPEDERALAALERDAAVHDELAAALRSGAVPAWELGPEDDVAVPRGRATLRALPRPSFAEGPLEAPLARARTRLAEARARRLRRDAYDLVNRNCVTALFAVVEQALSGRGVSLPRPGSPLAFIPFAAAEAVEGGWGTTPAHTLPSLHGVALEHARRDGWIAVLRETSTLTSRVYTPHDADSIFLFFTDGAVLARPLLGAANLVAGVAGGAAGVLWLPVDGGVTLARGARGVASSLPELAFVSIRKGTFPWAHSLE